MKQAKRTYTKVTKIGEKLRKEFLAIFESTIYRPHGQKGRVMRTNRFNFALVTTLMVAALSLLAACGGGGGDTPTPSPTPSSTGSVTASATNGTVNTDQDSWSASVTFSTANVAAGGAVLKANGVVIHSGKTAGTMTVSAKVGNTAITLWDGSKQLATVTLTGSCISGTTPDATGFCRAPTTGLVKYWPPASTAAQGVTFTAFKQLPAGCQSDLQQCWWDAIQDGTVTCLFSGATLNNREVMFCAFINRSTFLGGSGLYALQPVFADDGSLAGGTIGSGDVGPFLKAQGNQEGVVFYDDNTKKCYQEKLGNANWIKPQVSCPVNL